MNLKLILNFVKLKQRIFKQHVLSYWTNIRVGDIEKFVFLDFSASTWDHKNCFNEIWRRVFRLSVIPWCRDSVLTIHFHSIFWEWINGIWPNIAYSLIFTGSKLGLLRVIFRQFVIDLWPLSGLDRPQNFKNFVPVIPSLQFVTAQYFGNKLMESDHTLDMHWYWQYLGWDCYASIFANL